MTYSSRFWLYAPLALFLGLAAFVSVHWWLVAGPFDKQLHALKGRAGAAGVTLDWSKVTVSGFPFRLDAVFDGFSARGAGAHGPFAWQSEHFALHALTYGRAQDIFEAAGRQTLSWTDSSGAARAARFLPASLRASDIRDGRGLARFDLDLIGADGTDFSAGRLQLHMRRDPDGKSLDLMVSADEVKAAAGAGIFGPHIRTLRLYAGLTQEVAFAPLLQGRASLQDTDAAWRQAGGTVRIGKLEVQSSNLTATIADGALNAKLANLLSPLY